METFVSSANPALYQNLAQYSIVDAVVLPGLQLLKPEWLLEWLEDK